MPIFETNEERTFFLTTFLVHPEFATSNNNESEARNEELTENEQLILYAIETDAAITISSMVSLLGIPRSTVQRTIKALKEKNRIRREGSNKKGSWIILK